MTTLFDIARDPLASSTPPVSEEAVQYIHTKGSITFLYRGGRQVVFKAGDSDFLESCLSLNQGVLTASGSKTLFPRFLPPHAERQIFTPNDVCNVLRSWGEYALADRIAYFASDADLEDEDIPATLESVRGFLTFFGQVKSDGRISLTCSPEGWLCAVWRFSDERRASLWFLDSNRVMFSATDAAGNFIEIDGGGEVGSSRKVMAKLVQAGLFTWDLDTLSSANSRIATMLPGNVVSETLPKMAHQWMERFYSEKENSIYPPTGWNTFTNPTDHSRLTASFSL